MNTPVDQQCLAIHNLRNNLNTISMQTELAKMLLQQNAAPESIGLALDKILQACERCSNQLHSISQPLVG